MTLRDRNINYNTSESASISSGWRSKVVTTAFVWSSESLSLTGVVETKFIYCPLVCFLKVFISW